MYYCFNFLEAPIGIKRLQKEIERAKRQNEFIYYNTSEKKFFDQNNNVVDVHNKEVFPVSGVLQLKELILALEDAKAVIPNTYSEIEKIEEWYKYIEPLRYIVNFKGKMLEDNSFLSYLYEVVSEWDEEIFLKTRNKDFNGFIKARELFDVDSDLRKAFSYHSDLEFIISKKVEIDKDELGNKEYRAFIMNKKIMNISRTIDFTYHTIPEEILHYIEEVLEALPKEFPETFVLDVFSYGGKLDILEFNPIEGSGKYLYNSVFEASSDLLHQNIEEVPVERIDPKLSYENYQKIASTTIKGINGSFAKDYDDIKKYGDRQNGFVHVHGLPPGAKINLAELLSNLETIENDQAFNGTPKEKIKK